MKPPPKPNLAPSAEEQARLVRRFRDQHDDHAFAQLYRLTRRQVFATCLRYLKETAAAEDACHDVFVQAYERFESFRGKAFSAWVRRIAVHHCLNELRHHSVVRRSEPEIERALSDRAPTSTFNVVRARQELTRASELVRALAPKQRLVFLLRHVEQLTYGEIARITALSHDEVRSSLQNARRNFRLGWQRQATGGPRHLEERQEIDHG